MGKTPGLTGARRRVTILVSAGLLVIAGGLAAYWWLVRDEGTIDAEELISHENRSGGYRFGYPEGWALDDAGTTSKVTSPDQGIVVTFGHGPSGAVRGAAMRLAESFLETYDDARVLRAERQPVGGRPAVFASGIGTNESGVRIRFLAIVVKGPDPNYAIAVFTAAAAPPAEVVPTVNVIVDSFRVLPPA